MKLDWSEQSPHIRTLFHPWQPGDGYEEATLQAAETRLGVHLPALLRTFYQAWGQRDDMTAGEFILLHPDGLVVRADTLIFWREQEGVWYWEIQREALEKDNPPVVITEVGPSGWGRESKLNWRPSHPHLSGFLDDLTYLHAFAGGAIHGGWTQPTLPDPPAHHIAWLEEHWSKASGPTLAFGLMADPIFDHWPPLYVRDGQALLWTLGWSVAAREAEVVDEIAQRFQIRWARRW